MTETVKKWDHVTNWGDQLQIKSTMMALSDTGKYVLAADYARLEQELGNMTRDNQQLTFALSQEQQAYIELRDEVKDALKQVEAMRELLTDWAAHFTGPKVSGGPLSSLRERTYAAMSAKP